MAKNIKYLLPGKSLNSNLSAYSLSIVVISGTALICSPLANTMNYHLVSFILLFVVSVLSTFVGMGPILVASSLSALVWNFFFIPPHHTFNIAKTEDILIFGLFFIIALTNGVLTTRVRRQEQIAREREKHTNALFQLTKELSKASGIDDVLKVAVNEIHRHFSIIPVFFLQDGNNKLLPPTHLPTGNKPSPTDFSAAEWVFQNSQPAGAKTLNTFASDYTFFPLNGTRVKPGVVAIKQTSSILQKQRSFWETFITQVSNALEREFLGNLAQKVRFLDESDRLYKTLFNSISHELRIPIATIMGAADTMINPANPDAIQSVLAQEIFTASLRLNRLIENLLNISRLESGHISVRLDWHDVNDLVNKVAADLKDELKPFSLAIAIPDNMPLVKIDFGLMEQVLYNLLFNATQYAPVASEIVLKIWHMNGKMYIELTDSGPGFPEAEIKKVFNKFYKVNGNKTGGLGLGLSIAKGFTEAHNGHIKVENLKNGGAKFTIEIPTEVPEMKLINNLYQ